MTFIIKANKARTKSTILNLVRYIYISYYYILVLGLD